MERRPILVIDDDPLFCELVTARLMDSAFDVLSATDGPSGIELARTAQPAVILLDLKLPGVDGIATCKRLKRDYVLGDIPVVAVTASLELKYTEQAFYAGADFFLSKPFSANRLLRVVELAAKRSHQRKGRRASPRFPAALPVRCCAPGDAERTRELMGQTGDVSLGGVLLFLPETLPPGLVLGLQLALPSGPVTAEGTVVWRGPQPAVGGKTPHGIRLLRFVEDAGLVEHRRYLSQLAGGSAA